VATLAVTQTVLWGTLYYAFAVFLVPMTADLDATRAEVSGACSIGLLVSGLAAPLVGRIVDRRGGRAVMTAGAAAGVPADAVDPRGRLRPRRRRDAPPPPTRTHTRDADQERPVIDLRAETLKALRATPAVVTALTRGLDPGQARRRPAPGEWAAVEVVAHLADTDERALARVRRMLDEDDPELPGFDQDALAVERGYLDMDLTEQARRYTAGRAAHVALLEGLDDAGWQRTGRHEAHGLMTIELYEVHVANEDVDHLAQLARLVG